MELLPYRVTANHSLMPELHSSWREFAGNWKKCSYKRETRALKGRCAYWNVLDVFDAVVEHGHGLVMGGSHQVFHCLLTLPQYRYVCQRTQEPQSGRMGE